MHRRDATGRRETESGRQNRGWQNHGEGSVRFELQCSHICYAHVSCGASHVAWRFGKGKVWGHLAPESQGDVLNMIICEAKFQRRNWAGSSFFVGTETALKLAGEDARDTFVSALRVHISISACSRTLRIRSKALWRSAGLETSTTKRLSRFGRVAACPSQNRMFTSF